MANRFAVVERISNRGHNVAGHVFGTDQRINLNRNQIQKLPFYEGVSNFRVTQYALYYIVQKNRENIPMYLARINVDTTGRIRLFNNMASSSKSFFQAMQKVCFNNELSPEEKTDNLLDLMDDCPLAEVVKDAISLQDWLLAIILHDSMLGFFRKPAVLQCFNAEVQQKVKQYIADAEKNLLSEFAKHIRTDNARRKVFQSLFPHARGLWIGEPPTNFNGMRKLAVTSLDSYIRLDRLSRITSMQDWGSAILDVLLLTEGTPGAAELEKEFDNAVNRLARRQKNTP